MAIAANQRPLPNGYSDDELDELFCGFLAARPNRAWLISEVLSALDIDFSLQVSQRWVALMEAGRVDRVAPALYQYPASTN